jgi:lipooligosaccharide transport system permease protein
MAAPAAVTVRTPPAGPGPVTRPSPFAALEYWLRSYRGTWKGSVFSSFVAPLLYLGSLGFGLGALVDSGSRGGVDGVPYAVFVAPGVLAATAMQAGLGEATYPVLGSIIWNRTYLAMLATPLRVIDILLGHLMFIGLRLLVVTSAFAAVGAGLGAFRSAWVLAAVPVAVLCGLAHVTPVMAYAARLADDQGFSVIFRLVMMPMFLFAGTFFPVDQLPAAVRPLAWLTPLWHGTQVARSMMLGRAQLWPVLAHLAYLLLWFAVGLALARLTFRRRLVE